MAEPSRRGAVVLWKDVPPEQRMTEARLRALDAAHPVYVRGWALHGFLWRLERDPASGGCQAAIRCAIDRTRLVPCGNQALAGHDLCSVHNRLARGCTVLSLGGPVPDWADLPARVVHMLEAYGFGSLDEAASLTDRAFLRLRNAGEQSLRAFRRVVPAPRATPALSPMRPPLPPSGSDWDNPALAELIA